MSEVLGTDLLSHQRQAEKFFCAAVLRGEPAVIRSEVGWLEPDLMQDERWREYWRRVRAGDDPMAAAIAGKCYSELIDAATDMYSINAHNHFAAAIRDDAYLLKVGQGLGTIARAVGERDREAVHAGLQGLAAEIPDTGEEIPDAVDVALQFIDAIERKTNVIKTGIRPLDHAVGGFEKRTLTLIAARPSMGKTTLGFQIARNAALAGHKVLFFSLEMTATLLWAKAACGALEVNYRDLIDGQLKPEVVERVRKVAMELAEKCGTNLRIDDNPNQTTETLWAKIAKYRPDMFIADHTSLMSDRADNEVHRLGNISRGGAMLAKQFDAAAIYLQQLNRGTEGRQDKRPTLSDLRDSGELEQNADQVLFIYRDDYYKLVDNPPKISPTELILAKFRMGAMNQAVKVDFHTKRQWFFAKGELDQYGNPIEA